MRPTTRTPKKAATTGLRSSATPNRALTPDSRRDEQEVRDSTSESGDDLSRQIENLIVTPASPRSAGSRPRVDSGTSTPTPKKQGRKRSSHRWGQTYDV